jgi:hypothetical protein
MSLTIPASVLETARVAFEEAGAFGQEATGLLSGHRVADDDYIVRDLTIPDQRAGMPPSCWVEVTELGKRQLAAALGADELWIARIHSHPGEAFHSPTDDSNQVLTAEGSWSIVVPYFGLGLRRGISACAVLRLKRGRWHQLDEGSVARGIRVTGD